MPESPTARRRLFTPTTHDEKQTDLPAISDEELFSEVVEKLFLFFTRAVETPSTFEQLRTSSAGYSVRGLVSYLADNVHNPHLVSALL